ncbi:MAG TPA: hypothetical protein VF399_01780 [bacterium]
MIKSFEQLFSTGSLYFFLIQCAAIFLAYMVSVITSSLSNIIEDKNPRISWIVDALTPALLMFIMCIGYGIGYDYLSFPSLLKMALEPSRTIILFITLGVLLTQFLPAMLLKTVKSFTASGARMIQAGIGIIYTIIIILMYIDLVKALVLSLFCGIIFYLITVWMLSKPKPRVMQQPVIPKKLVISHVYISTTETHENIEKSVRLIREAITETVGTGDSPQVSPSGFIPGAVDIILKYFVMDASQMEQIKSKVNLNIIKKLSEHTIKMAST